MAPIIDPVFTLDFYPTSFAEYHQVYYLQFVIYNNDQNFTITSVNLTGHKQGGTIRFFFPNPPYIRPSTVQAVISSNFDKFWWVWYKETPLAWLEPTGPYTTYNSYTISDIYLHFENLSSGEIEERSYPNATYGPLPVNVSAYKRNRAEEARDRYTIAYELFADAICWAAIPWVAAGFAWVASYTLSQAQDSHAKALGCPKYMDDYKQLGDYKKNIKKFKFIKTKELSELYNYLVDVDVLVAIRDEIVDTRNRFYTALKMQDDAITKKQRSHLRKLLKQGDRYKTRLINYWSEVELSLVNHFNRSVRPVSDEARRNTANNLKSKGLEQEHKEYLSKQGLSDAQVGQVDRFAKEQSLDNYTMNPVERIKEIQHLVSQVFDESSYEVNETEKVDSLKQNDTLMLLLKDGLITMDEFNDRSD